jgi:hydroxymethylpyrimidine pyrophosphatase-like HAD family hydrolase
MAMPPLPPPPIPLRQRLLLSSDFDDTLVGNRADPRHSAGSAAFAAAFTRLRHPGCGTPARLAINTGRTLPLFAGHPDAELRLEALGLRPDVLIAGVGTRVYWRRGRGRGRREGGGAEAHEARGGEEAGGGAEERAPPPPPLLLRARAPRDDGTGGQGEEERGGRGPRWVEDAAWTAAVGEGWDARAARRAVEDALASRPGGMAAARFQRDEELHAHKLTVSFEGGRGAADAFRAAVVERFAATGASREPPRLVAGPTASSGGRRWYADVLPRAAGKGNALRFVAGAMRYGADEIASAGDSHNDECMLALFDQRRAIVVGNAHAELRASLGRLPHVWCAPEDCVGAAAVLRGLACAGGGGEGWVEAAALDGAGGGGDG